MTKQIFKEYLTNELNLKTSILENNISEEDKATVQNQIDNLQAILNRVEEMEDTEVSKEVVEGLVETVNGLGEKLTALSEKIQLNKNNEDNKQENEMDKNYLESKNSLRDFASAIRNAKTAEEFRSNWNEYLVANDVNPDSITIAEGSEDAFLPAAVKGMINDIWDKNAGWLRDLNYTGAKRFYVRHNNSNQDDETSRAKGWKKGQTKTRQDLEFSAKLLEGQFIYKIAEIDLKTKFDDDMSLINYVIGETTDQLLYEIRRAILVGDGRLSNDPYKIDSFEAIAKGTTDAYTVVTKATSNFLVDDMRAMVDGIHNPNDRPVYVFMSKTDLRTLARVQASETSTPVYMSDAQVAEQIGADRIITTDLLGDDFTAVAMIPSEYYMVGAPNLLTPVLYTWHEGYKNLDVYRNETVAGGGLNGLKSSAVLLPKE